MNAVQVLPGISEREFVDQVAELARLHGWHVAHFRPGRTVRGWRTACQFDAAGFPDLFLVREHADGTGEAIAFECKVGNGRASPCQLKWLRKLRSAGIPATVVRPSDWNLIEKALQ